MFFLAPASPPEQRRGLVFRVFTGVGLAVLSAMLSLAAVVLTATSYFLVDPTVSPKEIYHRTWQAVRDNIYDQSKLKDWDAWEHKFDHLIVTDADAIRYAREMVNSLGDPYTFVMDAPQVRASYNTANGKFIGVGILFEVIVDADGQPVMSADGTQQVLPDANGYPKVKMPLRGGPAHKAGINPGDSIKSIDGKPTHGLTLDALALMLKGEQGTVVSVVVVQSGKDVKLDLTRGPVSVPIVSIARLPGNIGYLRVEAFDQLDTAEQIEIALIELANSKALIVDVRGNPGGFVHTAVLASTLFLDEGTICSETVRIPKGGYLTYKARVGSSCLWIDVAGVPVPMPRRPNLTGKKPIVVLANGGSASAAEIFLAALQDNSRAVVIGAESFGKGIGQTYVPVGNGVRLRITNFHGVTPKGRWLGDGRVKVANGVRPDLVVEPNDRLLFGGVTDNQLRAALEYLLPRLP